MPCVAVRTRGRARPGHDVGPSGQNPAIQHARAGVRRSLARLAPRSDGFFLASQLATSSKTSGLSSGRSFMLPNAGFLPDSDLPRGTWHAHGGPKSPVGGEELGCLMAPFQLVLHSSASEFAHLRTLDRIIQ